MDFGVMTFEEFWPEMKQSQVYIGLLKDFAVADEDFSNQASKWTVVEDGELPDHVDGFTSDTTISVNPEMEDFNKLLTFIHELTHAFQFITGENKVTFKSDSTKLKDVRELQEYLNDKGERQAARSQVVYLSADLNMNKDEAYEYMKLGWGIEGDTKPEVLQVTKDYFDELWNDVVGRTDNVYKVRQ